MSLRHRGEAAALRIAAALVGPLPRRAIPALGAALGAAAWVFSARRRRTALENLSIAYGASLPESERRRIARGAFSQFGRLLIEGLRLPRLRCDDHDSPGSYVRYNGLERARAAYESGRGVIVFSAHFGNWELTAAMQACLGMPLTMVTRPLDNPHLETLLAETRGVRGNRLVHKKNALRPLLAALTRGGGIAILIDQNVRDGSAVWVPYFGRAAATTPALGLLALRTNAVVLPVFSLPQADGSYEVTYLPVVVPETTGDRAADALRLTARCTEVIEEQVRRHPTAWLWMHERWKTRPIEEIRARRRGAGGAA